MSRRFPALLALLLPAAVFATDYGDAPSSYGLPKALLSQPERLGTAFSDDTANPVTPAWTGDNDDGVAIIPTWSAGTSTNSVSVFVYVGGAFNEYLTMFVDFNDDGDFTDSGERIDFPTLPITQNGTYTFNNISIPSVHYSRNGVNKIGVRFILKFNALASGPADQQISYGEVEDYLFNVIPNGLFITTDPNLPPAIDGQAYSPVDISAANGTAPYAWTVANGSTPPGMSLAPIGNSYRLSGLPSTSGLFQFTVQVTDSASGSAQRQFTIQVLAPPGPLPFFDDFSTDKGWTLGSSFGVTWQRAACGPAHVPDHGLPEATLDHSPDASNFILGDNIGADYPDGVNDTVWATSPYVDCTGVANVELRLWRWLNVEKPVYDQAMIQVTGNYGSTWVTVWSNGSGANQSDITDNGWVEMRFDISGVAGGNKGVRVRIGIGSTDADFTFSGWCVDDLEIRARPDTTRLVATDFRILSPYTVGSQADPRVYTGTQTPFEVVVDNVTPGAILVDSFVVDVFEFTGGGNQNIGSFTLTPPLPVTVPASATGMIIAGTLDCTAIATSGANVALRGRVTLLGHEATPPGLTVETTREEIFYVDNGPPPPPPMLETREVSFTGPLVSHLQPAAGSARDFGTRDINNGASAWLSIMLINTTSTPVQVTRPTLAGPDAAHFRIDTSQWTQPSVTLATSGANRQIFFSVRFDPHDLGVRNAIVQYTHNASLPVESPFEIALSGEGTGAPPALEAREVVFSGPQVLPGAPAAGTQRDFDSVAVGQTSRWLNIVLWNRFVTPTAIGPAPTVTGPDAGSFVIDTSNLVSPIPGSTAFTGTTFFSIRFAPLSAGPKSATVSFGHNASNPGGAFTFEVVGLGIGTGGTPLIAVAESVGGFATFAITNGSQPMFGRDFGTRVEGSGPSAALEIRVSNTGNASLAVGGPGLAGQHAGEFTLDASTFVNVLAPGQGTTFTVAFEPLSPGVKLASISFTHTAATQTATPFLFILTGLGIANSSRVEVFEDNAGGPPIPAGSPAPGTGRDFGSRAVDAGASPPQVIMVRNVGSMNLNLGTPAMAGANPDEFELDTQGTDAIVAPGASTIFSVAFDPSSYGPKTAIVAFTHDDPAHVSPFTFEVMGFGDSAEFELHEGTHTGPLVGNGDAAAGSRDFGNVDLGAMPTATHMFTVVNAGNAALTMTLPTLTGPNAASFQLFAPGFATSLAPGQNASFSVRFNASQVGLKEAVVSIGHNDGGIPTPFVLNLKGKATSPAGVRITGGTVLPRGRIGVMYSQAALTATGGAPDYTWSVRPGSSLPLGLSLSQAGIVWGTPGDIPGDFSFVLRVTDSNGGTDDATFSIQLEPAAGAGFGKPRGQATSGCAAGPAALPVAIIALAALARRRQRRAG